MSKKNKDGWIRHRGGKRPVDKGVMVEFKRRDRKRTLPMLASDLAWEYDDHKDGWEIMQYRLHTPTIETEVVESADQPADGPLQWRDRIRDIDTLATELQTERADLIKRLADEGLQLLDRDPVKSAEDMSDWRNWRVGDMVEVLDCGGWANEVGSIVKISLIGSGSMPIEAGEIWYRAGMLKFHSRP